MPIVTVDRQNLEIAIQTVLHQYQSELELLREPQQTALIKKLAFEISHKARMFQALSEHAVHQLEVDGL
ncbi:hypothetical protein [Paenibacillus koleovorans]|uniref:hypothetical protein n=1 Tax=Paenibacillus koleovorans TaxID=121608 RepID=UPI000FDB8F3D|nr:hypothetical protein [Paenibacillus koleovorans]